MKRTPIKRSFKPIRKVSDKKRKELIEKLDESIEYREWLMDLWDERDGGKGYINCFETGIRLSTDTYKLNSACYSHLLPKGKYEQYKMYKCNVEIVHPDAHSQFEIYPEKAPNQFFKAKILYELHKDDALEYYEKQYKHDRK